MDYSENAGTPQVVAQWLDLVINEKNALSDVPEGKIKHLHGIAHHLYSKQLYDEASIYFRLLATARPTEAKFWKGLGACEQMKHNYQHALNCYASAQLLNGNTLDPSLYIHAADCYFALKQRQEGLKALEAASQWAEKFKDQRILSHTQLMKQLWSNK